MKKILTLVYILIIFNAEKSFSQDMKFGKFSQAEKDITAVDFEPDADAVVLEEYSVNNFNGGVLHNHYHKRVKILKESGTRHGNVVVRYFFGKSGVQNINKVSAQIVNFDGDQEQIIKLTKNDFYTVDGGNGWQEIRFTLPEVKVGSIYEFEYNMQDKGISFLDSWVFQNRIPTLKSTYSIKIPSYLNYRLLAQGDKTLRTEAKQYDGMYKWELTDLYSIKDEPYMSNHLDYLERLDFQLAGYVSANTSIVGGRSFKDSYSNWQELTDFLFETNDFSSYLKPSKVLMTSFRSNGEENTKELEKAKEIYSYVQQNIKYNDRIGYYPSQDLKSTLEKKQGSRADINLTLLAQLRSNGLNAYPVMLSSKGNGRSRLVDSPFLDQFNQLIVLTVLDGREYYLDATNEAYTFGHLPLIFHVDQGYLLKEKDAGLVSLAFHHRSGINQIGNIKLNENGKMQSRIHVRFSEYDAISKSELKNELGEADFGKEIFDISGESLEILISEKDEPKKIMDVNISGKEIELNQQMLMISPFTYVRWHENPLKADTRTFPIDLLYTFNDLYSTIIEIPEGYELDDFPEPVEVVIPGNIATFTYKVEPLGNTVKVSSGINFKYSFIPAAYYPELKYFMGLVSSKLKEPVILKKTQQIASAKD